MKTTRKTVIAALAALGFSLAAGHAGAMTPEGMVAKGGQLYDWFYQITEGDIPKSTHKAIPAGAEASGKGSWRCSTCHGFNYAGDIGLKGVNGAKGKSPADIVAILKDDTHGYTSDIFTDLEFNALGEFVSKGVVDVASLKGNSEKGKAYFETICAVCHGMDGKKITDMPPVGAVVNQLPERSLHRIRFSKPGASMPALSALPLDVAVDVWEYTKTLPQ